MPYLQGLQKRKNFAVVVTAYVSEAILFPLLLTHVLRQMLP